MSFRERVSDEPEPNELDGVAWPIASGGDASLPWVEKDDDYDTFADDVEAALHVSKLTGMPVMFTTMNDGEIEKHRAQGGDGYQGLRPFVFAFPDSSMDDVDGMDWSEAGIVWQRQREERFGSRRARYDEAMKINSNRDPEEG